MNYFDLPQNIDVKSNVGGFGIDGACSTLLGQSLVNKDKKCFGLIGDLAFFYDMNILGNRHISNNLRFLLVNNSRGAEFLLSTAYINKIAILHSVVEFENGWIMDFNYDLVMQKDLYFALFGFEVLSELTSQEIFVKDKLFNKYSQYIKSYGHGYRVFASDALLEYAESCENGDQSCRLAIGNF